MNDPAYRLVWNLPRYGPEGPVCRMVEFPGWDTNTRLARIQPLYQPSEPVEFDTHFELLEKDAPDYPSNTPYWPVMSHRMLNLLRSVGEFEHHTLPVTLVRDTAPVEVRYDHAGRPKPEYSKANYVAVQLTSYADVFDIERSDFRWNPMFPDSVISVNKYVFRVPESGLPALFRLEIYPIAIFVSAEARTALDAAGIRGPLYRGLDQL